MASKKLTKTQIREDRLHNILAEGYGNLLSSMYEGWKLYVGAFLGFVVLLVGAYLLWGFWSSKAAKASMALSKLQEAYSAKIAPSGSISPQDSKAVTFPTEEARRKEVDKLIAELKKTGAHSQMVKAGDLYKAQELARGGKYADAVKVLDPLVGGSPMGILSRRLRATLLEAQGQWDKAEADWKALAGIKDPLVPEEEGLWWLGQFYERRQQTPKAIEAYEKALGILSAMPDDYRVKARIQTQIDTLKGTA